MIKRINMLITTQRQKLQRYNIQKSKLWLKQLHNFTKTLFAASTLRQYKPALLVGLALSPVATSFIQVFLLIWFGIQHFFCSFYGKPRPGAIWVTKEERKGKYRCSRWSWLKRGTPCRKAWLCFSVKLLSLMMDQAG